MPDANHRPLILHLPEEIAHYEPELKTFFDLMILKLHVNRHKGFGENKTLADMRSRIYDETIELTDAICSTSPDKGSQFDVALECVDIANQAWLLALVALRMDKKTFEEQRPER